MKYRDDVTALIISPLFKIYRLSWGEVYIYTQKTATKEFLYKYDFFLQTWQVAIVDYARNKTCMYLYYTIILPWVPYCVILVTHITV